MILVATAGYSYQDWRGTFYPKGLPAQEMLGFYAEHFPFVELNTTFYRMPDRGLLDRLAARARPDFFFVVKAFRGLTHEWSTASPQVLVGSFAQFRLAVEGLRADGRLGAVLAQFPNSFRNTSSNQAYLARWREELAELPVIVEFRHRSWLAPETEQLLRRERLSFAAVDEPRLPGLLPPVAWATAAPAYLRFHGRNAAKWWNHRESWERYNYLYSQAELEEWVPTLRRLESETGTVLVAMNNHYQGSAPRNAQMLRSLLETPPDPSDNA